MRRILLLVTDLEIGGTPTVVRELALRLLKEPDVQVHVACLARWGPVAEQLHRQGVGVTALDARGPSDVLILRKLIRLIRGQQFDTVFSFLLHANAMAAAASLRCRGVRYLQSIQTTQPDPRWHWRLQRICHHAAEKMIVPSPSVAAVAYDWADIPQDKILVIPNAIDIPRFAQIRREHDGVKTVGFIGRLDPIKRVEDLVHAMTIVDGATRLEIYGEGSDRPAIESLVLHRQLDSRVTLHGAIADPTEALARMDALVLPSSAEGFGLVLIEAMAAGVPVIGTHVPGISNVITNNANGLLVPVADPKALAAAISRLATDSNLREKLIAGGLETVRAKYDWDQVYLKYREVLQLP